MKVTIADLDPFPIGEDLAKHRHHFEDNARVTVIDGAHKGRSGKLEGINNHGGHLVRLDSGDLVEYHHSELEPEGFSYHSSGETLDRVQKALATGRVSPLDRELIEQEIAKYERGEGTIDPFAGIDSVREVWRDPRLEILGVMAEKYAIATEEPLEKRKKDSGCLCKAYRAEQSVRDRQSGKVGKVTRVDPRGAIDVDFGGGNSATYIQCENSLEAA